MILTKTASSAQSEQSLLSKIAHPYLDETVQAAKKLHQLKMAGHAFTNELNNEDLLVQARLETFSKLAGRTLEGFATLDAGRALTEEELTKKANAFVRNTASFAEVMGKVANVTALVEHRAFEANRASEGACPVLDVNDAQTLMRAKSAAVELSTRSFLDGEYDDHQMYDSMANVFHKAACVIVEEANAAGYSNPEDINKAASVGRVDKVTEEVILKSLLS